MEINISATSLSHIMMTPRKSAMCISHPPISQCPKPPLKLTRLGSCSPVLAHVGLCEVMKSHLYLGCIVRVSFATSLPFVHMAAVCARAENPGGNGSTLNRDAIRNKSRSLSALVVLQLEIIKQACGHIMCSDRSSLAPRPIPYYHLVHVYRVRDRDRGI